MNNLVTRYINLDNNDDFKRVRKYDEIKMIIDEHTKRERIGLPPKASCYLEEEKSIDFSFCKVNDDVCKEFKVGLEEMV